MEAWLDMRTIRIPRPKLVSTLSVVTATAVSVTSVTGVASNAGDALCSTRSLEELCLESGVSVNPRSLNGGNGLADGEMEGHN